MTALETMEGEETLSAVAYLLSLAIKRYEFSHRDTQFERFQSALMERN